MEKLLKNLWAQELFRRVVSALVLLNIFISGVLLIPFSALRLIIIGIGLLMWMEAFALYWKTKPRTLGGLFITAVTLFLLILTYHAILEIWAESGGGKALIFVCITVWVNDSCAYLCGKWIGGPKLAPTISPNKTWSGALGGLLCALLWGVLFLYFKPSATEAPHLFLILTFWLTLWAQIGDLLESATKRYFGVKDSGTLIPGHGGLWDRLDGLVFALLAFFCGYKTLLFLFWE